MLRPKDIKAYSIELPKLKSGKNEFDFLLDEKFLKLFEKPLMKIGKVAVAAEVFKNLNHLDVKFKFDGFLQLECDRCGVEYEYPINVEHRIIYAFRGVGTTEEEETEVEGTEVIYISRDEHLLDLTQELYDYVCLEIPIRKVPEDCDDNCPRYVGLFKEGNTSLNETDTDPRWEALRRMKSNNSEN
jgi:uncharacterized metal-binding protein YceD (DUF177 family)